MDLIHNLLFPFRLRVMRQTFLHDLLASVVVFFVAMPLCMGIAIAAGVEPAKGLITGIIGGLVVGFFAGSPLQVSGPAAGLVVIVYELVREQGLAALGPVVLVAGLIQFVAGLARLGQWFRAVAPAVVRGMLAGIGVLIFASQFHVMMDDTPKASGFANLASIPAAIWKGAAPLDGSPHHWAALIGILTICTIAAWKLFVPKKLKFVPAPLVAVVVGTLFATVLGLEIKHVAVPDSLLSAITLPSMDDLSRLLEGRILWAGVGMAIVASAETLLCASAIDQMQHGRRTRYDQELAAQGVGNMLCGLVGALPMTGVIVRSAANVEAGGRTRLSTILHGVWILAIVSLAPSLLRLVPTACLAAILFYTGYKLLDVRAARELLKFGKGELLIYLVTLTLVVSKDLLFGVMVGVALAAVKLLYEFSHLDVRLDHDPGGRRADLHLAGAATFVRLPKLATTLERVHADAELHVHLDQLQKIDHACLELLANWERQHRASGGSLVLDWGTLHERFNAGPSYHYRDYRVVADEPTLDGRHRQRRDLSEIADFHG